MAVFDSLDQAVAAWQESKGDTARTARPEPVTDYSQPGFLVRCDMSPNGPFRGDESRGYADNLFRADRRGHDIADAMAWRATSGRTKVARAVIMSPRPGRRVPGVPGYSGRPRPSPRKPGSPPLA